MNTTTTRLDRTWWKEGTIYQIYPRSFCDSNGDGIGDLPGILQKIPYLKTLGVDIIWLSPVYQSPNDDNGYDISDYQAIMPAFGSMADFDALLEAIHAHGMRLVMDLVVNHTSDEHRWFQEAKKGKDNPYRDYYIWRSGREGQPPNNWKSFFSGSAWEYDEASDEYYLHLFTRKQPDLNWDHPKVRQEVYQMMRFWLDKGIDGFRMDVIPLISKPPGLPDVDWGEVQSDFGRAYAHGPKVHQYLQEMHREVLAHYDILTIGEGVGVGPEQANLYVGRDRRELNMIFHFGHMWIDFGPDGRMDPRPVELSKFTGIFETWEKALGDQGWNSLYLGNHDFPRMVSRFGHDQEYHCESAKLLATLLFTLKGTPGIYQGDEIGMTNTPFQSIEEYRDVEMKNAYREMMAQGGDEEQFLRIGQDMARDHARTPMQWDDSLHAGFSQGVPWIRLNDNYPQINVAAQENDPASILNYYRQLLRLRKQSLALVYGETEFLRPQSERVYAYRRRLDEETYHVVLNFSSQHQPIEAELTQGELILGNYAEAGQSAQLRPWEARVYRGVKPH
jgi:oligo-1,6-glucosidase